MPAPLAKGIIIAASIVVAAGIALYESPQVRQWVDQSRRKIAVALHSLGDDIQPRRASESSDDFEQRKARREDLIRRNRNELIRRAREEGVAVDLDELARIGKEDVELAERRSRADRTKSFDDMVGSDGMLHKETKSTGFDTPDKTLRKRGAAGFAAGAATAGILTNPFDDDQVFFDHEEDEDEAPSPKPFTYVEPNSRETTATLDSSTSTPQANTQLIDLSPDSETHESHDQEDPTASTTAQSFYSFTSSPSASSLDAFSTGTLTPRSDRTHSLTNSPTLSRTHSLTHSLTLPFSAPNSTHPDTDDTRSEVFSEGGFTDAGFSDAGFSEFGAGAGVATPSSWTDVGSDEESEWGGNANVVGNGGVSQVQQ